MRNVFVRLMLIVISASVAMWLRMLHHTLSSYTWQDVFQGGSKKIIGSFIGAGLLELVYFWWGYLIFLVLYLLLSIYGTGVAPWWKKPAWRGVLSAVTAYALVIIGHTSGGGLLPTPTEALKLLLLYSTAGVVYGWLDGKWNRQPQLLT